MIVESEAAPGLPRARDFNATPASEWEKLTPKTNEENADVDLSE